MLNLGNVQRLSNGEKVKVIRMIWFNEVNEEKLKLEQTLVEYDREPMLFICKGVDSSKYFLCTCFELFIGFKWALVEVTKDTLFELWKNKISIHDTFCKKDAKKFIVEKMMPDHKENSREVSRFESTMLPEKNVLLENHLNEVQEYFTNLFCNNEISAEFICDLSDELFFEQWNTNEEQKIVNGESVVKVALRKNTFGSEFKLDDYHILQQAS